MVTATTACSFVPSPRDAGAEQDHVPEHAVLVVAGRVAGERHTDPSRRRWTVSCAVCPPAISATSGVPSIPNAAAMGPIMNSWTASPVFVTEKAMVSPS